VTTQTRPSFPAPELRRAGAICAVTRAAFRIGLRADAATRETRPQKPLRCTSRRRHAGSRTSERIAFAKVLPDGRKESAVAFLLAALQGRAL
jgi:hypothetical protein